MMWVLILALFILVGAFFFFASYHIHSGVYLKTLCKKRTSEKVVAITFDDGPDPDYTMQVLNILQTYRATATFFCIGEKAESYPEIVRRIQRKGHLVGNHSYTHSSRFPFLSPLKMQEDLQKAQVLLEQITAGPVTLFRPPFGVTNPTIAKVARRLGYTTIGWSVRSFDTREEPVEKILHRIIKQVAPGDVILLHDRLPDSAVLLTGLLEYLQEKGYKTKRIDELFELA